MTAEPMTAADWLTAATPADLGILQAALDDCREESDDDTVDALVTAMIENALIEFDGETDEARDEDADRVLGLVYDVATMIVVERFRSLAR